MITPHRYRNSDTATSDAVASGTLLARAVAVVLEAQRSGAPVRAAIDPTLDLSDAVLAHRIVHVVGPHLEELGFSDSDRQQLASANRRLVTRGLLNMADTAMVSTTLAAAGVDHLVFKGAALSAMSGRHPSTRASADIDLWVAPESIDAAETAMTEIGWKRSEHLAGLPRPGDGWRWRATNWIRPELSLDHPDRSQVDLHWKLVPDRREIPSGEFALAYEHSIPVPELGPTVRTLAPDLALLHIAQHGRKDGFATLRHLTDVVDLAARIDTDELSSLATRSATLRIALAAASSIAPWLADAPATRRERRLAADAVATCLTLRRSIPARRALTGRAATAARIDLEWWCIRSAPSFLVAARLAAVWILPQRLLFADDRNPVRVLRRRRPDRPTPVQS